MYVYVTFWAPRGAHAQRANVTGSIKGLKVTVKATSYSSALLLLMKSLGVFVAVLVRYVRRTADYSTQRRQRTPCTGISAYGAPFMPKNERTRERRVNLSHKCSRMHSTRFP